MSKSFFRLWLVAASERQRDLEQGRVARKAAGGKQKTLFITSEEAARFPGTFTMSIIDRKYALNRHSQKISNDETFPSSSHVALKCFAYLIIKKD